MREKGGNRGQKKGEKLSELPLQATNKKLLPNTVKEKCQIQRLQGKV